MNGPRSVLSEDFSRKPHIVLTGTRLFIGLSQSIERPFITVGYCVLKVCFAPGLEQVESLLKIDFV
jgi:hypothetical protein